jgi:adenylosuccinate lyase
VRQLERRVAEKMGFAEVYAVTGQTYSRKVDAQVLEPSPGSGKVLTKRPPTCGCWPA